MKKCFTFLMILLLSGCLQAQTWEEWTRQKKTQIKYLLEQIVAIEAYGKQLKQGYEIVQQGLSTIHSINQGDFSLHEEFFFSLKKVNPNISRYTKLYSIILMQTSIVRQCNRTIKKARESGLLNKGELEYLDQVSHGVFNQSILLIDEFSKIITPELYQLSDGERIDRIDTLYTELQEHYLFAQHFQKEVSILVTQKVSEHKDISRMRSVYIIE